MTCRAGETEQTRFRSDRLYAVENKYFFSTREGSEIGPFDSHEGAEQALERYLKYIGPEGENETAARAAAMQGEWASTNFE
ncbi:MAG: DUF6316 family protein [Agarilytica sp.]